jgi:hypothetical protein
MPTFRQGVRELVRLFVAEPARPRCLDLLDKECHERGMQLLRENLSAEQRKQYDRCKYFDVVGGATGRRYRIRYGHQMNVEQLGATGGRVSLLCLMPVGCRWVGDVMLAQKIALELFETEALSIAHKSPALDRIRDPRHVLAGGLGSRW